jgi:hypothetical protein
MLRRPMQIARLIRRDVIIHCQLGRLGRLCSLQQLLFSQCLIKHV